MFWINAEFNFFFTAIFFFNCVKDFKDLMFLIISFKNDCFWNQFKIELIFNSFQVSDSDFKIVFCLIYYVIDYFIWNDSELLNDAVNHHIKKIWQHCLLCCYLLFCISFNNDRIIENSISFSQICCYQLSYYNFEQKQYDY